MAIISLCHHPQHPICGDACSSTHRGGLVDNRWVPGMMQDPLYMGSLQHTIGFSDIQRLFIFILADVGWISRFLWLNVKSSESLGSFIFFHL